MSNKRVHKRKKLAPTSSTPQILQTVSQKKFKSIAKFLSQQPNSLNRCNSLQFQGGKLPTINNLNQASPHQSPTLRTPQAGQQRKRLVSPEFRHSPIHFLPTSPNFVRKLATASDLSKRRDYRCSRESCVEQVLKSSYTNQDFQNLKFEGQNREKVGNVVQWLNLMKEKYLDNFLDQNQFQQLDSNKNQENLGLAESIIKLGLNEVFSQVALNCFQRGEILKDLFELFSKFTKINSQVQNSKLKNKIKRMHQKIGNQRNQYQKDIQNLKKQIENSTEFNILKDLQIATKSQQITQLRLQISKLQTEKEFLLTTEIKLYDQFNQEKGTANFQQLLSSDSVHNFRIGKNYRFTSSNMRPYQPNPDQMRIKPTFSKQMNNKDLEILDPFFVSRQTQVQIQVLHKNLQSYIQVNDKHTQTEQLEDNISFISYGTSIVSDDSNSNDQYEGVPSAIIVTTDNQQTIVQYAFLPSKDLAKSPNLRRINSFTESPYQLSLESPPIRRLSVVSQNTRLASDFDSFQPSSILLPIPESLNDSFNLDSDNQSEDSNVSQLGIETQFNQSNFGLSIPDQINASMESPRKHTLNPDPFTDIAPIEISHIIPKKKKFLVKKKHVAVQTEKDLVLQTEQIEILDQMIEWKQQLLKGVDQELVRAKSKLTRVSTVKSNQGQNQEVEKQELPEDLDEYLSDLREKGELTPDMDSFSWKGGFVHGLVKAHKFNGDVIAFAQNQNPKHSPRTPSSRTQLQRGKSLTKEFNFSHPDGKSGPKRSHPSRMLLSTLQKQENQEKYTNLTKRMLYKKLFLIYSSAMGRQSNGEILPSLSQYVYNYIQERHQENLIGDKKYLELMASALKASDVLRIQMFIRLVGMGYLVQLQDYSRPDKAFEFYISLVSSIFRSKVGIVVSYHDTGEIQYIPKNRAIECLKECFGDMFSSNYLVNMIRAIDRTSKSDPLKINMSGVVSQDFVLELAMNQYEKHSRDVVGAFNLLTQGFDLGRSGYIHVTEFIMIIRHLVPQHLELFLNDDEYSELILEFISKGKGYILVDDLTELCVRRSLISMEDLKQIQVKDSIKSNLMMYNEVIMQISEQKEQLKLSDETQELWRSKIRYLNTEFEVNAKSIYLAFNLFFQELDRLKVLIKA